jgi:kinesin family protein 3/17
MVTIESSYIDVAGETKIKSGKLNMVDLAGSEKQKKTMINSAQQKKEAIKINLSLTTLRKVINDLVKRS